MSLEKGKELALVQRAPIVIPDAQNLRVFVTDLMNSEFFKSVMKAPQAIAIVLYGQALGLEPVIALQTIQPVNGRMCISTTVLQALFQRKGGRVKVLERSEEKARVEFSFPGWDPYIHEYTKHDAIDEQLWEKDNWKKRRKTMLLYRAISGGLKVYDPGSHLGIVTTEEAEDYPNGLPEDAAVVPEKEKGSQKAPESAKEPVKQAPAAKKEASPAPGAAPAKEKPAEAQKEASKPQPAAQPKDASEPALTGFEVPEGEDDISAMAEHAESRLRGRDRDPEDQGVHRGAGRRREVLQGMAHRLPEEDEAAPDVPGPPGQVHPVARRRTRRPPVPRQADARRGVDVPLPRPDEGRSGGLTMKGRKKDTNGLYDIFGVELPRVTAIIGRLRRYGLDEWQATCAVDFMLREFLLPLQKGWMSLDQLKETNIEKARLAAMDESRNRMKAAQDLGRQVHAAIHRYYKCAQDPKFIERTLEAEPELRPGLESFQEWERLFRVDMIGTEKQVFSFEHGFAGTLDLEAGVVLPAEDFGADAPVRHMVIDFKTGAPDPVVVMQLAAYAVALEEMTRTPMDGGIAVYLNPETGIPKWKIYTRTELEPAWVMFSTIKKFVELEEAWKKREPSDVALPPSPPNADSPSATDAPDGSLKFE